MSRIIHTSFMLFALSSMIWAGGTHSGKDLSHGVFFDARTRQTEYAGPGREKNPAADVKEVLIGYFGPGTSSDPRGGDMWSAACLAVEQANRAGGYNGLPFRLVAGWSNNPWGSGVREVTRMAYVHKVWAVIGGIDGPSTHLAEQVVAKARLTLLSSASTDKTVNLANVPWMFSCLPADHLQAPVLAQAIASEVGEKSFLLVSAVDHDSHLFTVELTRSFIRQKLAPSYHFEFKPGQSNYDSLAEEIVHTRAHTLVLIAAARQSSQIISAVRQKGFKGLIFGGPCMGRRSFIEQAGDAAEAVVFPLLYTHGKESGSFDEKFTARFGRQPDYLAAHTYDAVNLLIAAIRKAGLNRPRINDAVRSLSPWQGITGKIQWDPLGSNSRLVNLGTIRNGRMQTLSKEKSSYSLGSGL
ncbi:MAG TPA: ABC transporter substrate-binding protein [Sedimentisphaerales bacterium]|nr:ABC transporter substrate-binding protein [Sedimentisphaerales bacterium]